ncbi:protoporphyrinogen oxidase [Brevibacillus reuszeri]|uniref:Coproporphyrinogen III oxidase n=1 Tax=Brevibacillus reuszeri TaxID=54915 RepID=A0A0K9YZ01_9BACL|nr:protoporphyrinogen oxidase [Brevibacillus reuszeri]KNB73881.1 protoporphyrinogen oxidase [Brevibacillus reuszeri]MED1859972.1 protoporphyrinogen oxidase [Brevibacillus reuszeri]GED71048.1 protoporphyrinogen oxidase [Brevibacillus reuszeri]
MNEKTYHITIVGGGITGLTAAFYLQREIEAKGLPIRFQLIEEQDRLGGKIKTWRHEGFVIEQGPDSFLERKTSAAQLAADLGQKDDLVRNSTGQAYIWHKDKLVAIPEGAVMGVPTRLMPFVSTDLISWPGKIRAAADLILPATEGNKDISVGDFFRRRLGDEVIENLIQPLLSGVYSGDIDKLSLLASFPQFAQLEKQHRSLILAMKHSRPQSSGQGKPKGIFLTLKNGLESLVEGIEKSLPASSIQKETGVQELLKKEDGGYTLVLKNGQQIETDAVLFTVPHAVAEPLLRPYASVPSLPQAKPHMVATIAMAFGENAVDVGMEGTGFIVPRHSGAKITACTWAHRKWPHTTPANKVLLRSFVGKAGEQSFMQQTDEEVLDVVLHDLRKIMSIPKQPDFYKVTRLQNAIPYVVGHLDWVRDVKSKIQSSLPGVLLAGASYSGVGVPDCIDQGKKAVSELIATVGPGR